MYQTLTRILSLGLCLLAGTFSLKAQDNIKYGPNYIVVEAEDTPSNMDNWALRTPSDPKYYLGTDLEAINQTYIEYTGPWGAAASPLSYTFVAPSTGVYRLLMRMYQPLEPGEAGDKKNDVFIRMEGNYTSETQKPKSELEKNHKFWGRGVRKWGSCHKLEIGAHMDARYGLIAGETYTLVMSGRSKGCSIDYILLYDVTLNLASQIHTDIAAENPPQYRPFTNDISLTLDTSELNLENIGDTYQLIATVKPDTTPNKSVSWTSEDPTIASVDSNGLVTAVSNGKTMIRATADANGYYAQVEVLVGKIIPQPMTWTATQITGASDIITDGTLLEAINFAGGMDPTVYNTTLNTVPFAGAVSSRTDNVWENPSTAYFSANSVQVVPPTVDIYDANIGLPELDVLLSQFLWTNGAPTEVTISNLTVGNSYKIQLFAADTRASQGGSFIVLEEKFGSPDSTPFTESNGLSIVGEFTAVAESFSFLFSKVTSDLSKQGINLNAYQLRQTGVTSIDGSTSDQGFSIAPNPSRDWITITAPEKVSQANISIYSLDGRAIYQDQLNQREKRIRLSSFAPAVYIVKFDHEGKVTTQKLIIN